MTAIPAQKVPIHWDSIKPEKEPVLNNKIEKSGITGKMRKKRDAIAKTAGHESWNVIAKVEREVF